MVYFTTFEGVGCYKLSYDQEEGTRKSSSLKIWRRQEKKGATQNFCTNYYPFGFVMNQYLSNGEKYRFGYQGETAEDDSEETGFNHFEAREWDSRIGRWMVMDPLRQFSSGYVGMGNNPVNNIDPDGRYSKFGAWWRNGFSSNGLVQDSGGEWGFTVSQRVYVNYSTEFLSDIGGGRDGGTWVTVDAHNYGPNRDDWSYMSFSMDADINLGFFKGNFGPTVAIGNKGLAFIFDPKASARSSSGGYGAGLSFSIGQHYGDELTYQRGWNETMNTDFQRSINVAGTGAFSKTSISTLNARNRSYIMGVSIAAKADIGVGIQQVSQSAGAKAVEFEPYSNFNNGAFMRKLKAGLRWRQ